MYRTLGDYMISTSGSFEDFMEQFKKRHAKDYGLSGGSVAVKAPMAKVDVKKAPEPVSVVHEVDRKSAAAGGDFSDVWDDTTGEAEVIE